MLDIVDSVPSNQYRMVPGFIGLTVYSWSIKRIDNYYCGKCYESKEQVL